MTSGDVTATSFADPTRTGGYNSCSLDARPSLAAQVLRTRGGRGARELYLRQTSQVDQPGRTTAAIARKRQLPPADRARFSCETVAFYRVFLTLEVGALRAGPESSRGNAPPAAPRDVRVGAVAMVRSTVPHTVATA